MKNKFLLAIAVFFFLATNWECKKGNHDSQEQQTKTDPSLNKREDEIDKLLIELEKYFTANKYGHDAALLTNKLKEKIPGSNPELTALIDEIGIWKDKQGKNPDADVTEARKKHLKRSKYSKQLEQNSY